MSKKDQQTKTQTVTEIKSVSHLMLTNNDWENVLNQIYGAYLAANQFNRDERANYWRGVYVGLQAYLIDLGVTLPASRF